MTEDNTKEPQCWWGKNVPQRHLATEHEKRYMGRGEATSWGSCWSLSAETQTDKVSSVLSLAHGTAFTASFKLPEPRAAAVPQVGPAGP